MPLISADEIMTFEPAPVALDQEQLKTVPSKGEEYVKLRKEQEHSSSSGSASDSEDQEISDDDDDDRNHKHRKRDSRPQFFDNDNQGLVLRRPIKRPNRTVENGDLFNASRLAEAKDERSASFDKDPHGKFDKHSSGMAPFARASVDFGQRGRANQSRNSSGSHMDLSASFSRPSGSRGRGRGTGIWSQHDSRFGQVGTLDFPAHMAPRGPSLPGLFVGTGLPNSAGAQNTSWGSFGFIPGMPNGHMDSLHPLSLPGAFPPSIGPQLNLGMPRKRCRDFEEQGFCLRGDMCPMEHGVNRIVVEDVQSLSQFNLPVSLPSSQSGGIPAASGPLPSLGVPSGLLRNKPTPNKVNKSVTDDGLGLKGVLTSSTAGGDNDVYDPDQPLWTNDSLDISHDPLSVPDSEDVEYFQDGDPLLHHHGKLPYKSESVLPCADADDSSRGRPGSGNKPRTAGRRNPVVTGTTENDISGGEEVTADGHGSSSNRTQAAITDASHKISVLAPGPRFHNDFRRNATRMTPKALRTLFVSCIPTKNNRRDSLLSHFLKFGNVVDIHIPRNGERAFIQFSTREEAEAALESPEAVMGNRFIKLFWANRDNIVDGNECMEGAAILEGATGKETPVTLKTSPSGGTEPLPSASKPITVGTEQLPLAPKVSTASTGDTTPLSAVPPKGLIVTTTPKTTPVVQKKRENLEMLKEELRRKQELLDQKRNEFKNQLEKLEKQSVAAKKSGATSEKPVKKFKVEKDAKVMKSSVSKSSGCTNSADQPKASEVNFLRESFSTEDSKFCFPVVLRSTKSLIKTDNAPETSIDRSEMDNQLFGFRILPPLPVGFADLAVIKEHFSAFQDLISIDIEVPKTGSLHESSKAYSDLSANVFFSTIQSAEKAFSDGSFWQGKPLKFSWLTPDGVSNDQGAEHSSNTNMKEVENSKFHAELMTAECSLSNTNTRTCMMMHEEVDVIDNHKHMNVDVVSSSLFHTIEGKSTPTVESSNE